MLNCFRLWYLAKDDILLRFAFFKAKLALFTVF